MHGIANILCGSADILLSKAGILSGESDMLHVQHQIFEIISHCFGLFKGKFFSKSAKKLVLLPKTDDYF